MDDDAARMRWFGTAWNRSFCEPEYQIPVPVGQPCAYCEELFEPQDDGFAVLHASFGRHLPYHYECHMRQITGSVGHLNGWCSCFGGDPKAELDPEAMTKRQAAKAAVAIWERQQRGRLDRS